MKILIAQDEAFNFVYHTNIDALKAIGTVDFFSPLIDKVLPPCDLLYLPGGYPELFAQQLSENSSMLHSIKNYSEKGGRVFAECGGFMYLCNAVDDKQMCGVLPLQATMNNPRLHLGYRQAEWNGMVMKGHEFHYSSVVEHSSNIDMKVLHIQTTASGKPIDTPIYLYKNVIAGYTHWYWAHLQPKTILQTLFQLKQD